MRDFPVRFSKMRDQLKKANFVKLLILIHQCSGDSFCFITHLRLGGVKF